MASKPVPKDPEKVARIMQAALHLFARDGYASAKTDEIAATAEISKGLLFHYFGSKQHLYVATVQDTMDVIMKTVMPAFSVAPKDLVSLVIQGTKYKTQFGNDHPDEMALLIGAFGETKRLPAKVQSQLTQLYTDSMLVTRRVIGQVIDQMPLRAAVDREVAIDLITGIYNQLFNEFQQHQQTAPISSMADAQWLTDRAQAYMSILENGLLA